MQAMSARPQGPPQPRPNVKYNQNVRNPNGAPMPMAPMPMPMGGNQLTAGILAKLEPGQQRQLIGERLYPLIASHPLVAGKHTDMAGKITGMLLEMEGVFVYA
jgi:polyadenylate-binding protein